MNGRAELRHRRPLLVVLLLLAMVVRESAARRGWGPLVAGFILALIGFAIILWQIWTTATIPLNTFTYAGIIVAGLGIALGAIGIDRGEKR